MYLHQWYLSQWMNQSQEITTIRLKSQETTIILKILWILVEIAIIITVIHNKFEILWSIKKRFDRDKILVIFFIILKYCENIENIVTYCEILWFVIGGCRYKFHRPPILRVKSSPLNSIDRHVRPEDCFTYVLMPFRALLYCTNVAYTYKPNKKS